MAETRAKRRNNTRLCVVTSFAREVNIAIGSLVSLVWNAIVPPWLEILLDFVGFAGFIGLAIWHKGPRKDDKEARR
jgi:hypothetical protein